MILILMLKLLSATVISGEKCEYMLCSNVFDYVCGMAKAWDGTAIISKYQNICHMNKVKCRLKSIAELYQIPNERCQLRKLKRSRRINDFGIVGAHQACNHTCPTYCVDTYEPACAQIWKRGNKNFNYRPMVNHCHIDLFSCAVGVNVTITSLSKCYKNPSGLLFMTQMAAMKSLGLLESNQSKRRSNVEDSTQWQMEYVLRRLLNKILFRKYKDS